VEEGVALALGIDPNALANSHTEFFPGGEHLRKQYSDWLELARRAEAKGTLEAKSSPEAFLEWLTAVGFSDDEVLLGEFPPEFYTSKIFAHLEPINFKASYEGLEQLYRSLESRHEELRQEHAELTEFFDELEFKAFEEGQEATSGQEPLRYRKLDDRRRKTFLKIILAISIEKYRFDPRKGKNSAPGRIATATEQTALPVSDETIRAILAEAVNEFPDIRGFFQDE
jgi:hypothetical protein